jgi:hypothetical protein
MFVFEVPSQKNIKSFGIEDRGVVQTVAAFDQEIPVGISRLSYFKGVYRGVGARIFFIGGSHIPVGILDRATYLVQETYAHVPYFIIQEWFIFLRP